MLARQPAPLKGQEPNELVVYVSVRPDLPFADPIAAQTPYIVPHRRKILVIGEHTLVDAVAPTQIVSPPLMQVLPADKDEGEARSREQVLCTRRISSTACRRSFLSTASTLSISSKMKIT